MKRHLIHGKSLAALLAAFGLIGCRAEVHNDSRTEEEMPPSPVSSSHGDPSVAEKAPGSGNSTGNGSGSGTGTDGITADDGGAKDDDKIPVSDDGNDGSDSDDGTAEAGGEDSGNDDAEDDEPEETSSVCPKYWTHVPAYSDLQIDVSEFCVMKYEAKNDGGVATSKPDGNPWVYIVRGTNGDTGASKACRDLGAGYDLISNVQWQAIARHIETAADSNLTAPNNFRNWQANSKDGDNALNRGYTSRWGSPAGGRAAHADDSKGCYNLGTDTYDMNPVADDCGSTWHLNKRTHTLPNGEVIWDLSGNVAEWVTDSAYFNYGIGKDWAQVVDGEGNTCCHATYYGPAGKAKEVFGPVGNDYQDKTTSPRGGLGFASANVLGGAIIRGGHFDQGPSGVFSVSLNDNETIATEKVGFRCVMPVPVN